MPLYQIEPHSIEPVPSKSFQELGLKERGDLQRLLKSAIHVVSPDTLVIAEEYSDWEDSRRRIDLLGLDTDGSLVVIELKRTEDGGHMDLQAIRYAAMISTMSFERVVEAYSKTIRSQDSEKDARFAILEHLGWSSPDDGQIGTRIRIVLVSANFSKEITTSVLWLNDQGLDIRCVRMAGHSHEGRILLDVQQVIPLPEAEDYMVKQREKSTEARSSLIQRTRSYDKYNVTIGAEKKEALPKRRAIFEMVRHLIKAGIRPADIQSTIRQTRARFYKVAGQQAGESDFLKAAEHSESLNDGRSFDPVRWFTSDDELLRSEGDTYAFSNQWGQWTEHCMKRLVEKYGGLGIHFSWADGAQASE